MSRINYNDRSFRPVQTSSNAEVGSGTLFRYAQQGDIVWASYEGGGIRRGTLVALADEHGNLDMRYAHVSAQGELMTGVCRSSPEVLPDGRVRLHEQWRWTSGDRTEGESIVEEVSETSSS